MVEPMSLNDDTSMRGPSLTLGGTGSAKFGSGDWIEPEKAPRDWKKLFLVFGLGALSWVATYVGMLELIESNMGDLPIVQKVIIGFAVAMLMTMIIWLLDQIFSPAHFTTKVVYVFGYLFLTVISVGFGFGFYWKVLESRGEATRSAESAISQVQTALHAGSTRLEQLSETLQQLTAVSTAKAIEERERGTTCPNSSPGDGPRRKLRDADAQKFAFSGEFVKGRVGTIRTEMVGLDAELKKIADASSTTINPKTGTRNEFMRGLNRRLDLTVAGFNAFRTDPQLAQIRGDLALRAEKAVFPNGRGGTFACPDPQLQTALRGVVRAIDQLPVMQRPNVAVVEGAEATIEAFRRLAATLQGAAVFELPPSADELRALQKKAVQSVSGGASGQAASVLEQSVGLSKRDYIPLAIAVFVDFCLLLVSIGRPINRLNGLVPVMREAERGPMIGILSRFHEIHRDPEIRQNFEVFRHVVFDMHGAYYVAVPLDAPYRPHARNAQAGFGYGSHDAQELQHEAHLLANLFSGFEQQKIFTRVYNPFLSTKAIQKKLWRQGSKFAGCQAFRVYRFRDGAWSNMILQAVMGAARRSEEQRSIRMKAEAEARASQLAAAPVSKSQQRMDDHRRNDPLRGFDTGLKLAPDVDNSRHVNGASRIHPGAMKAGRDFDARINVNGLNGESGHGIASGRTQPSRSAKSANGYKVNGGTNRPSRRRAGRRTQLRENEETSRHDGNGYNKETLRSAFGEYATRAAAEFSNGFDDINELSGGNVEPIAKPANGNTSPAARVDRARKSETVASIKATSPVNGSAVGDDIVNSLPDRSHDLAADSEVHLLDSDIDSQEAAAMERAAKTENYAATVSTKLEPMETAATSESGPETTVTVTRETAIFTVAADDARVSAALSAAQPAAIANSLPGPDLEPQSESQLVAPPPPPVHEQNAPISGAPRAEIDATAEPVRDEQHDEDERRWELTHNPFEFDVDDDDEDDEIVTIAKRLRPAAKN